MFEIIKAIIYGIIQGITEWLPVSSTGHLILAQEFIPFNMSEEFISMFNVVIQLGSILAVVLLYFHKLNPFSKTKTQQQKKDTLSLWAKVLVASLPAAVIGLAFDDFIDEHFFNPYVVAVMLIVYGIIFIIVEKKNANEKPIFNSLGSLTMRAALIIGIFQVLALIPGTSRSGATIIGALLIGTARPVAAEFTFFLAIPVMFGASLLKLVRFGFHFTGLEIGVLFFGFVVAFIVSVVVIKWLLTYIKRNDFKVFGYYRIALGLLILLIFLIR